VSCEADQSERRSSAAEGLDLAAEAHDFVGEPPPLGLRGLGALEPRQQAPARRRIEQAEPFPVPLEVQARPLRRGFRRTRETLSPNALPARRCLM
jgi:hypothetical protein